MTSAVELVRRQQQLRERAATHAGVLDQLAQVCADAHGAVAALDVADVTDHLARTVTAMQKSLRLVGQNVGAILQDDEQMRKLCACIKQADARALEVLQLSSAALLDAPHEAPCGTAGRQRTAHVSGDDSAVVCGRRETSELVVSRSDAENVRNVMVVAESMCTTMDHALGTITDDELVLASQLSLDIAQKLLEAGQALLTSLGDDERRKVRASERGDRITIDEVEDEEVKGAGTRQLADTIHDDRQRRSEKIDQELKHVAVLRTYVVDLYTWTRQKAVEHPFLAGAVTVTGLPFIGLAMPVACFVAAALVAEKYYPKHTKLAVDISVNFVQMSKLWWLLLKVAARQISVVATECFTSWHEYASANGYLAMGLEMVSIGCNLGFVGASYLYRMTVGFTKQVLQ